ncbi:Acg family FMN-binding oxidoreductase [Segnochrobactrum spirostomi]|uniref:Tat pathway signal protein n=1 Tax=Segnochrobactrum spirostomi TaxID=2608987 RepID=A0A6A7Y1U0_9HYPH|nr:nitroreductase family protein [Segnochrobactrum spirostomi]MQT12933.1 Tat pathway signal protein [Segnochrobactrum spirostomi]
MTRREVLLAAAGGVVAIGAGGAWGWRASVGSQEAYRLYQAALRAPLPQDPAAADLIRAATLAANGHNTQPWRFRVGPGTIDILPDMTRATPVVDPDDHHLFVSLGCAAENLARAGTAAGRPGVLETGADGMIRYTFTVGEPRPDALSAAIPARQSCRAVYDGRPVAPDAIEALQRAALGDGVRCVILTERSAMARLGDLVVAGNDAQMGDPAFSSELKHWLRFNPASAMRHGDGLYGAAAGSPVLPDPLGHLAFDLFVTAAGEADKYAAQMRSSAGAAIFFGAAADRASWIAVGRACQRFALTATALGLKLAFVNQPVEVARLRPDLAALAGEPGLRPDAVLRFGYGPARPFSPRRPVGAVLA